MNELDIKVGVQRVLQAVERDTGQGAAYHALNDSVILTNGKVCAFCRNCLVEPGIAMLCRISSRNATMQAMGCGEPYFYRCWAGLLFVTVPVAPGNKCTGGISLGGFYTPGEEPEVRETVTKRLAPWPPVGVANLLKHLDSLTAITPSALRGLGYFVIETTFSSGLNDSEFFRQQHDQYLQQRRIAEAYADMRSLTVAPPDILGDTYQLVSFLHRNDRQGAMEFVSKYLAKLLLASNWDLAKLKAHIRVLLAVITSQQILRGTPWAAAVSREARNMLRLESATTPEESCYAVAEWIREFFRGTDPILPEDVSLAERTVTWLQAHYQDRVTLAATAKALGTSTSTLVHRLKRETGKSFKQLLTEIRIAEAKKLLATTALSLSEIGTRTGFADQSHFTRAFKQAINLTPGQFRSLLRFPEQALRA